MLYKKPAPIRRVFTFGFGHTCTCGRFLGNCYTVIEALDPRAEMLRVWGTGWAFEYEDEVHAKVQTYRMTEIQTDLNAPSSKCKCGKELL